MLLRDKKLADVLPVVQPTYKSIDIRGIYGLRGAEWKVPFVRIRLTRQTPEEVRALHKARFDNLGPADNSKFKIKMEVRPIADFSSILQEVEQGSITIAEVKGSLMGTDFQGMMEKHPENTLNVCLEEEVERYGYYVVYSTWHNDLFRSLEHDVGLKEHDLGIPQQSLRSYLDCRNIGYCVNVVIVIPIYARLNERRSDLPETILAEAEIHSKLVKACKFAIIKLEKDQVTQNKSFIPAPHVNGEEMVKLEIPNLVASIREEEKVMLRLEIPSLELTMEKEVPSSMLTTPAQKPYEDALLPAFKFFKAHEKMRGFLFSKGQKKEREVSTSWLLALLGFRPIFLAFDESCEKIIDGKVEKESSDVIAADSYSDRILLVDNITTTPKDKAIQDIKNAAERINAQIGKNVIPVIFSGENCDIIKQNHMREPVCIVDSKDVDQILKLLESNAVKQARNLLLGMLKGA